MSKERGKTTVGISWPEWMPRGFRHALRNAESAGVMCAEIPCTRAVALNLLEKLYQLTPAMEDKDADLNKITGILVDCSALGARLHYLLQSEEGDAA